MKDISDGVSKDSEGICSAFHCPEGICSAFHCPSLHIQGECTRERIKHHKEHETEERKNGDVGSESLMQNSKSDHNGNGVDKGSETKSKHLCLLSYSEAPAYLQFNPYITKGYRGYLSTKMCIESMFWMTNETINIWSHIFGWMLFLGLTLYDLCLLNIHASFADKFIVGLLLVCFQVCMVMSALYHIFSCRSEEHFHSYLCLDLLGIALSMLAIYMTGVYYAYWCHKGWQTFYLSTVFFIFVFAMLLQIPSLNVDSNIKMLTFVGWGAYGVVPTIHWTIMMGGLGNPIVGLLLPRVIMMYIIIGIAFGIYITKIPERFFKGSVDFVGSSHQWWHLFVVVALYYWHNTGIKYIEYRMNHGCMFDLNID